MQGRNLRGIFDGSESVRAARSLQTLKEARPSASQGCGARRCPQDAIGARVLHLGNEKAPEVKPGPASILRDPRAF